MEIPLKYGQTYVLGSADTIMWVSSKGPQAVVSMDSTDLMHALGEMEFLLFSLHTGEYQNDWLTTFPYLCKEYPAYKELIKETLRRCIRPFPGVAVMTLFEYYLLEKRKEPPPDVNTMPEELRSIPCSEADHPEVLIPEAFADEQE